VKARRPPGAGAGRDRRLSRASNPCIQSGVIRALSNEPLNGRWLLTGLLGRGSTSTVYRGFDLVAERLVAIKAFAGAGRQPGCRARGRPDAAAGVALRRAQREFRDQARLRHPNLVEILELGETESGPLPAGSPFFTMELLEPAPLPTGLTAPPEPERLAWLAMDLLSALGCLHAHGLIHNDVKPSNVFLDRRSEGRARGKLGDFGLVSRGQRPCSASGALSGTLHYLAPEAISGARRDARTDLYSLGVVLFEAATGSLPFNDADPAAALEWHMRGARPDPDPRPALSPALARTVARLLQARPENRPSSAREAWDGIAAAAPPDRADAAVESAPSDGPLIGRHEERGRLATWLAGSARGGGRLRIVGPAGCGLSRFAREAALIGRSEGWLVHEWSCAKEDAPFSVFRGPLRELILRGTAVGAESSRPADGEILAMLGGPALWSAPGLPPGAVRAAVVPAITSFLSARVARRPLLVVVDDFERADEGSRMVLEALDGTAGGSGPGILVVTAAHEVEGTAAPAQPPVSGQSGSHDAGWPVRSGRLSSRGGLASGASPLEEASARIRLGPIGPVQARRLISSLPCMGLPPGAREAEILIRASETLPGRLARLASLSAGRQRLLFPPLAQRPVSG